MLSTRLGLNEYLDLDLDLDLDSILYLECFEVVYKNVWKPQQIYQLWKKIYKSSIIQDFKLLMTEKHVTWLPTYLYKDIEYENSNLCAFLAAENFSFVIILMSFKPSKYTYKHYWILKYRSFKSHCITSWLREETHKKECFF